MSLYTGCNCPICAKIFEEADDVVVCPECGSPHHRACYKAIGHCGNVDYHADGRQWEGPATTTIGDTTEDTVGTVGNTTSCRSCGAVNPAQSCFCHACGQRVTSELQQGGRQQNDLFAEYMKQPNIDFGQVLEDGVTVKEACDFVGPNSMPFALRFQQVARGAMTFNWCAFLFSFYYCFYRKMYKLGAVLLGVFLLTLIPSGYYSTLAIMDMMQAGLPLTFPFEFVVDGAGYKGIVIMSTISRMISLGTMMFCGLFFNRMYYKQMLAKVKSVQNTSRCSKCSIEYGYAVSAAGGVNRGAILMLCAVIFVFYMAIAYVATIFLL